MGSRLARACCFREVLCWLGVLSSLCTRSRAAGSFCRFCRPSVQEDGLVPSCGVLRGLIGLTGLSQAG